jgi:hypothetical protein
MADPIGTQSGGIVWVTLWGREAGPAYAAPVPRDRVCAAGRGGAATQRRLVHFLLPPQRFLNDA